MWKCDSCGEQHETQFDSCWKCGSEFSTEPEPPPFDERQTAQESQPDEVTAQFACIACDSVLRIRLVDGLCRCPKCKSSYRVSRVHYDPLTFLIAPQFASSSTGASQARPPHPPIPAAVKAALAVLGLDESAELEQARIAYRELVKSYHPDKVAHLGPELRQLAESKTKALNAAIETIKDFYTSLKTNKGQ